MCADWSTSAAQRVAALVALSIHLLISPARAQPAEPERRTVVAVRLQPDETLTIDGRLTEAVWRRASPAADFRQQEPANGRAATEPTEVRIVYDAGRLVVGVTCVDSEPQHVLANQLQRDQSFSADDRFMFTIDTYADGRSGYYFELNAAGAIGDGLVTQIAGPGGGGLSVNRSWDGIWDARVVHTESGWTAEIELPFRTLNFDRNATAWGINFQRTIRRKNEETLWTGWPRNQGLTFMPAAGRLIGLTNLSQGLGLDVRPYLTGSTSDAPGRGAPHFVNRGALGADLFYSVTPGLRANLTINTDFAETEVDQRQVNLTRFPLFFPEKRAFFLEGSNFFDFSREQGNAVMPFFSRRIGLDDRGVPQPIDYGAKLTGQVGAFDIGVLQVGTRRSGSVVGEQVTVVRAKRRFLTQSSVGGIFTRRSGDAGQARRTTGADVVLQTSHFLGTQVMEVSGWALSTTPRPGARGGNGYGVRLNYPNDRWYIRLVGREVQDGYDPGVGFVDRIGYRELNPDVRFTLHPNARVIRRISWEFIDDRIYDLDGALETRRTDFQLFRTELQSSDLIEFHLVPWYERLPGDFTIFSGIVLPAGTSYDFLRRVFQLQSATRRAVAVNLHYEDGGFYSGTRRQLAATVSLRPHRGWLIDLSTDLNRVELREGRFDTRVWRADVSSHMSPWISLVNTVQYDTVTHGLGWQSRFRWIERPGNDVYFVYTRNWVDLNRWSAFDQKAAAKIVTTYRF